MLKRALESLLFVSDKPLSVKELTKWTDSTEESVRKTLEQLQTEYEDKGMVLVSHDDHFQFRTHSDSAQMVGAFTKEELIAELTKPSLETLSIIAYKGPLTKMQLEQIRGVNCTQILRNLLMRGLVSGSINKEDNQEYYSVTFDFLQYLGVTDISQLPEYENLSQNEQVDVLLSQQS